jgi:hypothetical protein
MMTTDEQIEALLRQITELPDEARAELVQVLIEMRAEYFGVDPHDDEERGALARTAEDQRLGRFAPMKRT